eukprot:409566_1
MAFILAALMTLLLTVSNCNEIPYSAEIYNSLPHFWDTNQNSASPFVEVFGELFRQHAVEDFIGLQLLHKHFDVFDDEQIVDEMYGDVSIAKAMTWESLNYINSTYGVIGHRFKLTRFGDIIPLEFSVISSENDFIMDAYKELMLPKHRPFLYEFSNILSEFNLLDVFGIGIKHFKTCDTIETTQDGDRFHVTRSREDHVRWMKKKKKKKEDMFESTVFWDFNHPGNATQWPEDCGDCSHSCTHCGHNCLHGY